MDSKNVCREFVESFGKVEESWRVCIELVECS